MTTLRNYYLECAEMEKTKELIRVGLDSPKLFKRSCWNSAVKVMEYLCKKFPDQIGAQDRGPGREKYYAKVAITDERLRKWALSYKYHNGDMIYLEDVLPELQEISKQKGIPINNAKILDEFRNQQNA